MVEDCGDAAVTSPYVSIYTQLTNAVVEYLCVHPRREFWDALQNATKNTKKFQIYYNALSRNEKAEFEAAVTARVKTATR